MFDPVDAKPDFPALERRILAFWKEGDVAARSRARPGEKGEFVFYEGPPTANGRPGIHHVSARAIKDLFPRYKTMCGYRVGRRGGWDTHGLPVEVEVEKEIGSTSKADIERYGIERFNQRCRDSVFRYIQDWNDLTERIGFWIDLDSAYITYDRDYIESCWWILEDLWKRDLLYVDFKTTMHCPRCGTSLADHEVAQGMTEGIDDPSVWPKFEVAAEALAATPLGAAAGERPASFVAWTTTPWTLPANVALAVASDARYCLVELASAEPELFVVASERIEATFGEVPLRRLAECAGRELEGLRYAPILRGHVPDDQDLAAAHRVLCDAFVSLDDGTGIVHIATAYGDLEVGQAHGLPIVYSCGRDGRMHDEVALPDPEGGAEKSFAGLFFKDADEPICQALLEEGRMHRAERISHTYPLCWRDDTPLLHLAKSSWFIRTTALRDQLVELNRRIHWVPEHIRDGRFGQWLADNIDWSISRERYWGCPLPIWEAPSGKRIAVGSVAQLESLAGRDLSELDLHRPGIDEVSFSADGEEYRRVPYTIDVWFESGAMPYAQWHYPFENAEAFARSFPADFICEAVDQTRGWFYSLHAIAALLTDPGDPASGRAPGPLAGSVEATSAFRNCVVLGFVNDAEGRKMSKSRGNAVEPMAVIDRYGSDALRWYLYSSSPTDQNKNFAESHVEEVIRRFFLTLWNVFSFFTLYARIDEPDLGAELPVGDRPLVDRWLLACLQELVQDVSSDLDAYRVTPATRRIEHFVVEELSNWYVRSTRRRFWKNPDEVDRQAAYQTLHTALATLAKLCAPMAPFLSEELFQALIAPVDPEAPDSVHLAGWPVCDPALLDRELIEDMAVLRSVVELGRAARQEARMKLRQPVGSVIVSVDTERKREAISRLSEVAASELNTKKVELRELGTSFARYELRPNLPVVGKQLGKQVPAFRKALTELDAQDCVERLNRGESVEIALDGGSVAFEREAFLIDVRSPEGYAAVEGQGIMVAIETALSEELLAEGRVRDLVRLVQDARRSADLAVVDRIELGLVLPESMREAVGRNEEMLCDEVLATALRYEEISSPDYRSEVALEGDAVTISLRRQA